VTGRVVTSTPVTVRRCEERDLPHFGPFGSAAHVRYCREQFARRDEVVILVAVCEDDVPVGKVHVRLEAGGEAATIEAAAVVTALQGRGIGTGLIRAAEELARDRGFGVVQLGVEDWNPASRRLYERLGYRSFARMDFVYDGAPVPNPGVMMCKRVAVAA
jgi:ribosomal protein S18 acetylase RimI-like enzyme